MVLIIYLKSKIIFFGMERLTGIQGSMFSGKTTELMRFVERAEIAGQKVQVFKPSVDDRWGGETERAQPPPPPPPRV